MKKIKKKLVIVAIDGGTFNVINPLFKKNKLKNLKRIRYSGLLKSTIPPGTSVAWSSFATGNNPGKTGIYDFTVVDEISWRIRFINQKVRKGKAIWKYLDEANLKSCVINIPVTYPPDKINGVMISGIDAPSTLSNYTYPKEIKKKLKEFGYKIDVSGLKEKKELPLEAMKLLDIRIKTAKYFLDKEFDFFIVLFRASDIVQHFAWGEKIVERVYEKIDEFIGHAQDKLKEDYGNLIVMSDHGFEKVNKALNLNVWLEKEGYLKTNLTQSGLLSKLGVSRERIFKILEGLKLNFLIKVIPRSISKKIPTKSVDFEEALLTGLIDLSHTRAISKRAGKTSQIFLNKENRGGIVKPSEENKLKGEIKTKLEGFLNQNRIKSSIFLKEELYGKNSVCSPDITLYINEPNYDTISLFSPQKKMWGEPKEPATHNTEGVIFSDLNLKLENANIIDLAPTILKYFGVKGGRFDGKPLI